MPRPAKVDRPVEKSISLPESLCVQVDLILWSELEQRVPHGAWAKYVKRLVEEDLQKLAFVQEAARKLMEKPIWGG